ncbi:hypothetical protein EV401DRAFT_2147440 [Pisolithus croceorrhizus]|nr:hypothetical protein EV401DRAFT_2147440 [Pisolithus croceorrhizus]
MPWLLYWATYGDGTPELQLPWTSNPLGSHELQLDGELTKFDLCSSQELAIWFIVQSSPAQEVVTASPVKSMIIGQGGAKKPLVLYQPKGLSLPDNEEFKLLLKALSICLAHKDLVTTVIQCSELNVEERWMDVGGDLMLDGGLRSVDQGTLIPLYTVARPLAWCKDPPHPEKRQEFKNISITLQEQKLVTVLRLPSIVEAHLCDERSACTTGGKNTCNEILEAPLLLKKCDVLREISPDEMQKTRCEVESISQTLSIGLLEHIHTSFLDASKDNHVLGPGKLVKHMVLTTIWLVPSIDAQQPKSTVGRMEMNKVDQLLLKVLNHIQRKLDSMLRPPIPKGPPFLPSPPIPDYNPWQGFRAIAEIIQKTPHADWGDNVTHLQRIMLDTGAGVSRHELWLSARAAEEAKWQRVLRDNPIVDAQKTALNTSPKAPSM